MRPTNMQAEDQTLLSTQRANREKLKHVLQVAQRAADDLEERQASHFIKCAMNIIQQRMIKIN